MPKMLTPDSFASLSLQQQQEELRAFKRDGGNLAQYAEALGEDYQTIRNCLAGVKIKSKNEKAKEADAKRQSLAQVVKGIKFDETDTQEGTETFVVGYDGACWAFPDLTTALECCDETWSNDGPRNVRQHGDFLTVSYGTDAKGYREISVQRTVTINKRQELHY